MNANTKEKKTKKKLNAIDWFLIAAVVLCLIGAALRMLLGSESGSFTSPVVMEDYIVSYEIRNIRNSSIEYLGEGAEFYIDETEQYFGKMTGNLSVTPAQFYVSDAEGNYVEAYAPENGDATRVDVAGTMTVSGYMGEHGFLLNGNTSLAVNKFIALRSPFIYVTITITDIVKAS